MTKSNNNFTIGQFSSKCGLSIDTLRYYEKLNLLHPKKNNKFRYYTEDDFIQVQMISSLKELNFSLSEICSMIEFKDKLKESIINKKREFSDIEDKCQKILDLI